MAVIRDFSFMGMFMFFQIKSGNQKIVTVIFFVVMGFLVGKLSMMRFQ